MLTLYPKINLFNVQLIFNFQLIFNSQREPLKMYLYEFAIVACDIEPLTAALPSQTLTFSRDTGVL